MRHILPQQKTGNSSINVSFAENSFSTLGDFFPDVRDWFHSVNEMEKINGTWFYLFYKVVVVPKMVQNVEKQGNVIKWTENHN